MLPFLLPVADLGPDVTLNEMYAEELSQEEIISQFNDSVVKVNIWDGHTWVFSGTGTVIKFRNERVVLTAKHTVPSTEIQICQLDECTDAFIVKEGAMDWALLGYNKKEFKTKKMPVSKAGAEMGNTIFSINYGLGQKAAKKGIVSWTSKDTLGCDLVSYPGSSGGAIVNREGRIIGIVRSIEVFPLEDGRSIMENNTRSTPITKSILKF